jgi:arabinan endo-1,5-alpha-L-arabinosidase
MRNRSFPILAGLGVALSPVLAALMIACGGGSSSAPPAQAATSISLSLSNSTITAGNPVTLTATVTASGIPVTTGSVTFLNGSTSLAAAALNSSGQAGFSTATLAAGSYSLSASYSGTSAYLSSTSAAVTLTVNKPLAQTTVTLAATPTAAAPGLPVELVATVSAGSGAGGAAPTGSVSFSSGSTALGTAALDSTAEAHFTSTLLAVGNDSLTAVYSGDTSFSGATSSAQAVTIGAPKGTTYANPLTLKANSTTNAVSCADPAILKTQTAGVDTWYLYCTSDALYAGDPNPHYLNIFQSSDLVNWTYDGNAFAGLPAWANTSGASLWAPAIKYFNSQYYLYYAASATSLAGNGSAIGVGTSSSPAGPFVDSGSPVVEPELATNCCAGQYRSTIDPDEIQDSSGQRYILFGSFTGGLYVRTLSADGLTSDKTSEQQVAVDSRYEGGNWWFHGGYYYLFASSTNCCNGPLSGYGVFAGRATTPFGPYVDALGISMLATDPGGTPVIRMNGNSVIGPGGNVIFTDESGQDYLLYHGILAASPYYTGNVGYTARPGFIDAIDWINGWPVARGGFGPSDSAAPQPVPAAQPGSANAYTATQSTQDAPRSALAALSDDFTGNTLSSQWSFIHSPATYTLGGDAYQVKSVGFDPIGGMANVPLLAETAPAGDYMVETELDLDLPVSGPGQNYAQAGLLLYGDDNDFVRADLYNNNDTRQVEFIKAQVPAQSGYPSWGATNLGPAVINTQVTVWLRIVRRNVNGQNLYTAYSSNDGSTWVQGGAWIHALGSSEKICLYAGNQSGYTASFHYVHVSTLE